MGATGNHRRQPTLRSMLLVACMLCGLLPSTLHAVRHTSGILGGGTSWETTWYKVDSEQPGPTVLIVGGLHGNEPAGFRAAEQIRHWPIARGRLIVLPRANRLGLAADMRWIPEFRNDRTRRDANRNFPRSDRLEPLTPLCQAVWMFVRKQDPDWVFDLHEGFDFHCQNSKSVGSSVITFPNNKEFARQLVDVVNAGVAGGREFDLLAQSGPVNGGLARACGELLGAKSFILETTFKDQPISLRTRQHRRMISTALREIGVIEGDCTDRLAPQDDSRTRVALFDDDGANENKILKVLDECDDLFVAHVGRRDIRPDVLEQFDVILFPGGSGSKQGKAIGSKRREHVRKFVSEGGGIVGVCAGAYLCTSHYDWSLDLINAAVFNKMVDIPGKGRKSMWYRGPEAEIDVEATDEGRRLLGLLESSKISYQNGPILSPGNNPQAPEFTPLAFFRGENGIYDAQTGTMINRPAVVSSEYGSGRVLAISPHYESTPGQEQVLLRAVDYVRRSPARSP